MSTQFANAPIIELVAEVRWHTSGSQVFEDAQLGSPIALESGTNSNVEGFLARFGAQCNALGYRNSERVVPQGATAMPGQPIYRYRSPDHEGILVQAGWGVATVNAVPPYKSWTVFAPRLQEILGALMVARGDESTPFFAASVRYINAFGPEYLNGSTPSAFARDVLGFNVTFPDAVEQHRDPADAPQMALQLAFPTNNALRARMVVAEGVANDVQSLIFDTTLGTVDPVLPAAGTVFDVLNSAHDVAHAMFEGITQRVRDIMQPIQEG